MIFLTPARTKMLLFGFLLFFTACHHDEVLPVDEAKLADVLVEIHIAESSIEEENAERWDSLASVYYPFILKDYGMEREQFDTCLAILKRNPELMAAVYDKVIEKMEKKKLEFGDEE